ncbi:MAG: IPT/TIG domain-containing protein [Saprospiraceae bacterium]
MTRQIGFEGTSPVTSFVSQTAGKIEVIVPDDAHDGPVQMIPGSFVEIPTAEELTMLLPQITDISPNPVKNGQNITVTGVDLDLINWVTFGNGKVGAILGGGTASQITVKCRSVQPKMS